MKCIGMIAMFVLSGAFADAAVPTIVVQRSEITGCVQSGSACLKGAKAVKWAEGERTGWKLTQIKKGSLFAKLKLKEGDIVLSANGQSLTDANRIPYWMFQIVTMTSVDVAILRGGKPMRIAYAVKD